MRFSIRAPALAPDVGHDFPEAARLGSAIIELPDILVARHADISEPGGPAARTEAFAGGENSRLLALQYQLYPQQVFTFSRTACGKYRFISTPVPAEVTVSWPMMKRPQ